MAHGSNCHCKVRYNRKEKIPLQPNEIAMEFNVFKKMFNLLLLHSQSFPKLPACPLEVKLYPHCHWGHNHFLLSLETVASCLSNRC